LIPRKYFIQLFLILTVLFFTEAVSFGQSSVKPACNSELLLNKAKPDNSKVKLLIEIINSRMSGYFNGRNRDKLAVIEKLITEALALSISLNYCNGYNRGLLLKSRLLYIQNQDSAAASYHRQATSFYKNATIADIAEATYFLSESWKFRTHSKEIIAADSIYYLIALRYYEMMNEKIKEAAVSRAMAVIHIRTGEVSRAIQELLQVNKIQLQISDSTRHKTTDFLAHCSAVTGRFDQAFHYALQSLEYAAQIKDSVSFCIYNYRAGRVSYNLHEMTEGTAYLNQSLLQAEMQGDTVMSIHLRMVICQEGMVDLGKYEEALGYVLDIKNKYPNAGNNDNLLTLDIANVCANCYFHTGQYQLAEKYYLQALHVAEVKLGMPEDKIPIYLDIGKFYLQQKKTDKARLYFNKHLSLAGHTNSLPAVRDAHFQLFRMDSLEGKFQSAIRHFQLYKVAVDSMFNESRSKQIAELEIQYKTQQKEKEFQLLTNQNQLQQKTIAQGKSLRNVLFAGAALILLLLFVVLNRYQVKQVANKLSQVKQKKINEQNRHLEKLVEEEKLLLKEKDKLLDEKEWLMKEIHHRVKNNLQIVISLLNSQLSFLIDDAAKIAIKESQYRIHAIAIIHEKLYQAENLSVIDMATYIRDVADYLADNLDAADRISFAVSVQHIELDVAQAVPLGLIINEAIINSVKYAFPDGCNGEIMIRMQRSNADGIILSIRDDGIGLPKKFNWQHTPSLGMSLMRGLAKQLDGQFELINHNGLMVQVKFIPD
jgi:two-component system, sensor histidine kinase PdtaS